MSTPTVAAEPPAGFVPSDILPPPLAPGSGARVHAFRATRSPNTDEALVSACVLTPIPGWVDDMEVALTQRTTALAAAAAERIVGAPVEPRSETDGRWLLRIAGAPESDPPVGTARTFLAFDGSEVATCFAVCGATSTHAHHDASHGRSCDPSVAASHIEGGTPPPPAGLVLATVTGAIHAPSRAALGAGLALAALAVLAVVTRRKPRSRI